MAFGFVLWSAFIAVAGILGAIVSCSENTSLLLLSYPFFTGLTDEGRAAYAFGPLLGLEALLTMQRRPGIG